VDSRGDFAPPTTALPILLSISGLFERWRTSLLESYDGEASVKRCHEGKQDIEIMETAKQDRGVFMNGVDDSTLEEKER
jgi:hypothetical protein